MARLNATNFGGALQFPYATAATDLFKKEDVQTLALAVDQHTHDGLGKGLGVSGTAIKTAIDMPDWFRSTGQSTPIPASGRGIEMYWDGVTTTGVIQAYNRGGALYEALTLIGETITLRSRASGVAQNIGTDASTTFTGIIRPGASPGIRFASGGTLSDYPGGIVVANAFTVTPGLMASGQFNCNGPLIVASGQSATFNGSIAVVGTCSFQSHVTIGGQINAASYINFPAGGYMADYSGGYVAINNLTVTPGNLACGNIAINGTVSTNVFSSGCFRAGGAASSVAGTIGYGNEVGQGNGGACTPPLARGSGFGPAGQNGVGWVRVAINGGSAYFPYWV